MYERTLDAAFELVVTKPLSAVGLDPDESELGTKLALVGLNVFGASIIGVPLIISAIYHGAILSALGVPIPVTPMQAIIGGIAFIALLSVFIGQVLKR